MKEKGVSCMDCSQSQIAIMEYLEKRIEPIEAQMLVKHVLVCEDCRELYLLLDESQELLTQKSSAPVEATIPVDFVANVMEMVRKEPKYAKLPPVSIELKILWAVSAVVMTIALLVHFDPPWFASIVASFPTVATIQEFFVNISNNTTGAVLQFFQALDLQESGYMSLWAMMFVLVISTLLLILHREEMENIMKKNNNEIKGIKA